MSQTFSGKSQAKPIRLLVQTGEGRSASAILENNFLKHCLDLGAEVHVLSPGACYEPFVDRYRLPGTSFSYLPVQQPKNSRTSRMFLKIENRLESLMSRLAVKQRQAWLWKFFGSRTAAADAAFLEPLLDKFQPDCAITAHLNQEFSRGLLGLCYRRGIPTLGNVFSWDNPFYPRRFRPDRLTCWSELMRDNLVKLGSFLPEQIEVIGAPAFDAYFDPSGNWSRQELCDYMGLDSSRPILLFATLGQVQTFWDETGTFRAFLQALDRANLPGPPQVVLRLHPISVDHYFEEFRARTDVVFSRYTRYCPGMRWWPSREEMLLAGNLLRHADVCISPGSTMTVEAAIFDTPTIVPTFNPIMSEEYNQYFKQNWLEKHFRFLVENDTLCLADTPNELMAAVQRALADPTWMAEGRKRIRDNLLGPLDGRATERLAHTAVNLALEKNR